MNTQGLFDDINFLLGTTDTNFSGTDKYRSINRWYKDIYGQILRAMGDFGVQETNATATLTADVGKYYLNQDVLTLNRVEILYDPSASDLNWVRATPLPQSEIVSSITLSADIGESFSPLAPYYDFYEYAGSPYLELYPVPFSATTGGLKFWYNGNLTELSASAMIPVIAEPYHRILSFGASYDWAMSRDQRKANSLRAELDRLMKECIKYYKTRKNDGLPGFVRRATNYET